MTDNEIEAMRLAYEALSNLERGEQLRALRWLDDRLKWEHEQTAQDSDDG